MKFKKSKIFFYFFILIFLSCGKNIIKVKPDFQGNWCSSDYGPDSGFKLTITEKGAATWDESRRCEICKQDNHSGIARIKKDQLIVGSKKEHIDAYPSYDNLGNYIMVLNNVIYYGAMIPSVSVSNVTGTSATFSGGVSSNAGQGTIEIDYKPQSSSTWSTFNYVGANCTISGLQSTTIYEYKAKTNSSIHSSQYTPVATFTTQ